VFPQRWRSGEIDPQTIRDAAFGVSFMTPVDSYQKVTRATKYGILFILLPFLMLFLFEVFSTRKIHPLQYLFVGFAECIFYLLLLSLCEHIPFFLSYAAAAAAAVALISYYTYAVTRRWKRSLLMLPILSTAYAFLYFILRSEDYALLVGSLALFLILSAAMVLTRKIDWYGVGQKKTEAGEAGEGTERS
jgi:inner membrane protein